MGDNYRYNGTTRYGDSSSRLRRSPGLLGDNWFSRHSNHLSRYLGLDPQEERDPIQKEVDRALKYESESRCYQPPYPRYSTKPNLDSAGLPLENNLNGADHYTNGDSPSIARTGNSDRSAEQFIKLHRNNRVYRIKFPPGTLDNKIVTVADLRHIASRLFKIPFVNCFPIVDHYFVPATDGSENGVDAYTFGWCNGAEGWCYEVRDPLTGGSLSDRGERRWPGTVNLTSIGTGENESIVEVTLEQPSSPTSSTSGRRRNKKGGRKKTSAQGLRSRESESTGSNTVNNGNNNMGTGASREKAKSGRSHHHVPQETTSAPSGRPQLTTRSLEPPKYNLNAMPHSQVLALLNRYFMEDVKPCMDDYIAAPPTSPKQRDAEYLILNERCERDIILQLDALVCDGDTNMRAQRKALTNAVHQELKKLDEAVIAAGGKKRSG
ncbi:LMBR1 domain-containing protein [Ascosphaera apis ARSEF 7405]|uniref:LMBR1 domain-containing protein n=1 Tax=Ascosphaera apis ARSEF 7405 TaxID=392613 RepID=A0A167UWJ9_9EURO|nr:LMBR1 domain-containing protein [Ascosphaera apis ARSEF 7405]